MVNHYFGHLIELLEEIFEEEQDPCPEQNPLDDGQLEQQEAEAGV